MRTGNHSISMDRESLQGHVCCAKGLPKCASHMMHIIHIVNIPGRPHTKGLSLR